MTTHPSLDSAICFGATDFSSPRPSPIPSTPSNAIPMGTEEARTGAFPGSLASPYLHATVSLWRLPFL